MTMVVSWVIYSPSILNLYTKLTTILDFKSGLHLCLNNKNTQSLSNIENCNSVKMSSFFHFVVFLSPWDFHWWFGLFCTFCLQKHEWNMTESFPICWKCLNACLPPSKKKEKKKLKRFLVIWAVSILNMKFFLPVDYKPLCTKSLISLYGSVHFMLLWTKRDPSIFLFFPPEFK